MKYKCIVKKSSFLKNCFQESSVIEYALTKAA